ncbi:MAG: response regulator transcription factor [Melioribacteraceae bacterium]|nr:response regulator transcription factor [Melioribacteraceae bacterium]MCF8263782.1 response regulator transcription factor [Melioribacteraceae bacterium]MCF8412373.1 response regulator transcription factor [Melioribacteraceae bacterium]MCF8430785.1 response regulator transcription factor [Melioribacteraceae bacterium]
MKILVVEDNPALNKEIEEALFENGFRVETCLDLNTALEKIAVYSYDAIIVDIGLPDGSGLEIIKYVKQHRIDSAILILTAKDKIEDKVVGLNLGADDYMTKPFHKAELNARIHSIIRRNTFDRENKITFENIELDLLNNEVKVDSKLISLTKKEFDLLLYFIRNKNRVLTKESIAEHLWGDHADQSDNFDYIYNHIKNLRKKITIASGNNYIKAMYGIGYKFSTNSN